MPGGDEHLLSDILPYDEGEGFGIKTKAGLEGDNFRAIWGIKLGVSISGDTYWEQVLNSSIDKGKYSDISADFQFWLSAKNGASNLNIESPLIDSILDEIGNKTCVCVKASASLDFDVTIGRRPIVYGVGALALSGAIETYPIIAAMIKEATELATWLGRSPSFAN